ncbi:phosphoenolpyruvate carboxykinase (GTP) [bacterium]|nr:phosphoenolpyruvate carboxykinase (GTP) [bacterium]
MSVLDEKDLKKLEALNNPHVIRLVNEYVEIMRPSKVYVITDEQEDIDFVRQHAIDLGEEAKLKMKGHTIHYDSYYDQGRDKNNTKTLITPDMKMSKKINTMDREQGLKEILGIMEGIMEGKEMVVRFFALGPTNSRFTLCALQLTDSWYVAHSEDILYRKGYEQFKKLNGSDEFFLFVHSAGKLDGNVTSKESIEKGRRIYMDLKGNCVLTMNNQYAGNSLGLKKLALRLAIYKSNHEDWLTEHMFIMGLHPEGKNRVTYCTGAYPSACGKTSTAMVPGQSIVGDDIAYLRIVGGEVRAVNIESGVFGIIQDVNPIDDPVIYETLTTPRELIFSNILINDGKPYWLGMGKDLPTSGTNHSGPNWKLGDKDEAGKDINYCHPNARYTIRISELENADPNLNNPEGVKIEGVFYGGRDSDTNVPVLESLSWEHGIFIGATIESETTAATIGEAGVRKSSPMANMDFLVVPLSLYYENHRKFGNAAKHCPKVFATNYFLKENGKFTNEKVDKKVWLMWAEGRMHNEYDAIKTPVGYLPEYEDLKDLFKQIFNKNYSREDYITQFSLRVKKLLEKLDRMEDMYKDEQDIPQFFWDILHAQRKELQEMKMKHRTDRVSPFEL